MKTKHKLHLSLIATATLVAASSLQAATYTWTGAVDGNWDASTENWIDEEGPTVYPPFDSENTPVSVNFGDDSTNTSITVGANIKGTPQMNVNSSQDYTFNGGGITATTLTKNGSGKLTFANAGNTFNSVTILDGTVVAQDSSAFGDAAVYINGGTLEIASSLTMYGLNRENVSEAVLKFDTLSSVINFTGGYNFGDSTLTFDLNGLYNANGNYKLFKNANDEEAVVSGTDAVTYNFLGLDPSKQATFEQGVLTISPVPEPSTYALIGVGALAFVCRRRRRAVA